jgi:Mor family transcriptional regulator
MTKRFEKQLVEWETRRLHIYELWNKGKGMSYNALARKFHISATRVGQLINKVEAAQNKSTPETK